MNCVLFKNSITKREADDLKIVCYYSNWAVNRHASAAHTPENLTPYLCTHLNRRKRTLDIQAVTRRPSSRRRFPIASHSPVTVATESARITEAVTTLDPPTSAPDIDIPFECEDEGFFKNPKDCRKYFWCLDSGPANLGVVAHAFTCPSGLYFNTKTEACDYPQNVNCKQKGKVEVTTKKPKSRSRQQTSTTTTEAPSTSAPQLQITPELVAEALKLAQAQQPPQQNTKNTELTQLLQLVQSLGGIDKVQSLISNKVKSNDNTANFLHDGDIPLEGIANTRTTQSYFAPSYETPKRQEFTAPIVTTESYTSPPQSPPAEGSWLAIPKNQVRSRRPQYDYNSVTTQDPSLSQPKEERPLTAKEPVLPPQSPFNFVYTTPERSAAPKNSNPSHIQPSEPLSPDGGSVDGFFVYNSPGRVSLPSTRSTAVATESPRESHRLINYQQPANERVALRVSPGNMFRLPIESNSGGRRPMRVQVQSAFTVDDRTVPGVLYDEEAEIATHKPALTPELRGSPQSQQSSQSSESPQSPHSSPQIIAKRPSRKRPPQRPHLRDKKDETVPPTITNHLPPNSFYEPPQGRPEKELRNPFPVSRLNEFSPPTQPANSFVRQQTPRTVASTQTPNTPSRDFFPTEFPQYEYPQTQTVRQPFPLISATTVRSTPDIGTTSRPLRRGRPRRPSSAPSSSFQVTTPRKPITEAPVTPAVESSNSASDHSGPAVVIEKSGQISCGRRGVHPHPNSCAQFVVCAPGKTANTLRSYTHHCPAEQLFVKEVGRCRPGNRALC
ncbi:chitinase-like protein 1 [Leptotrombidium deliense]|uniref:Chitinase-like protein 1 n=1 Tax=Leptotrombidium deliense TaxID=299467 RepID=A0A443SFK7_9ACAR|nr:chitinase-like protein 1 [Leptotrombidium deliense]